MTIHILTDDKGRRYCRDGQFRDFANFGTGPTCVKVYKRQSWADKVIYRHNDECERQGIGSKIETWTIYHLYEGDTMDAFGNIQRSLLTFAQNNLECETRFVCEEPDK